MAFLGRQGVTAPLTSADIPDDSITAAKIVDGAIDFQDEIGFLENKATTQNLSGTYSTERMYLNDSYTLTGDVTVTGHLALGTVADADIVITQDSTERTITGSGTLDGGNVLQDTHRTSLTDMTGDLGSDVTGSPALNLGSFTGVLPVGVTGGSGLDAVSPTGISHASIWWVTSSWTGNVDPIVNFELADNQIPGVLGAAMTYSTGVFTFPQTGIWLVRAWILLRTSTAIASGWNYLRLQTTSNAGGAWNNAAQSYGAIDSTGDSNLTIFTEWIYDVTNLTNNLCSFQVAMSNTAVTVYTSTNENYTGAAFYRLGDT